MASVEKYRQRFGFYPAQVLADQIYCTRDNRKQLKLPDIHLIAKPLGRSSAQALKVHLRAGEGNPVEGKFGQAKVAYGLENKSQIIKYLSIMDYCYSHSAKPR